HTRKIKVRIYVDFHEKKRAQIPLSPPERKPRICLKASQIHGLCICEIAVQTARVTNFFQRITRKPCGLL
ncbi:MAG: hypothetical protein MJ065_09175, partial [Oscillospiraceae bacterium]|nr:hypothetical protein [Oscillospiraceae bacterium]